MKVETRWVLSHTSVQAITRRLLLHRQERAANLITKAMTNASTIVETASSLTRKASTLHSHKILKFDYNRDLQDVKDICANVYGGTDYMPRIIHRIADDPGALVLAAEAVLEAHEDHQQQKKDADVAGQGIQRELPQAGHSESSRRKRCIDGIICAERRGQAVWLYGLRVREGTRGRGLGHQLMEAIVRLAPQHLASAPDAHPPPPHPTNPALSTTASLQTKQPDACPSQPYSLPPAPAPPGSATVALSTAAVRTDESAADVPSGGGPIRHVVTCTVTYNIAAQQIIGRQLPGPLFVMEVWPGQGMIEEYEAAAGWVRGVGLPPRAPNMLDWIPGVRQVLNADAAAQTLLPHWRQVTDESVLRSAVSHLLYGSSGSDDIEGLHVRAGTARGRSAVDSAEDSAAADNQGVDSGGSFDATTAHESSKDVGKLLWLPMPYDLWPLESTFVQRELMAGNIWLLTAPPTSGPGVSRPAVEAVAQRDEVPHVAAGDLGDRCGGGGNDGGMDPAGSIHSTGTLDEEGCGVVGVMVLTYFETLSRVCAGVLARNNAAVHAAITFAGRLCPHFMVSGLRIPAGCRQFPQRTADNPTLTVALEAAGEQAEEQLFPAVYDVAGGHRSVLMYGGATCN